MVGKKEPININLQAKFLSHPKNPHPHLLHSPQDLEAFQQVSVVSCTISIATLCLYNRKVHLVSSQSHRNDPD